MLKSSAANPSYRSKSSRYENIAHIPWDTIDLMDSVDESKSWMRLMTYF